MRFFQHLWPRLGRMVAGASVLLMLLLSISCYETWASGVNHQPQGPTVTITPGWTLPAPPNAVLGQSFTASVPSTQGATYLWTVTAGSADLINTTGPVVGFTPTAIGNLTLRCAVTSAADGTVVGTYTAVVGSGALLNAQPATISVGQGTILLPFFSGEAGIINPGGLIVTSNVGITVTPSVTTTYTLNVDGIDVATTTVFVLQFTPKFVYVSNSGESLSAFTLDTATGNLTAVAGSPFTDVTPDQIVATPDGKFLFAAGQSNGVYAFTINSSTGALTPVAGSPFVTDASGNSQVLNIALDPYERFLYTSGDDGNVYAFMINPVTGVLTPIADSPYAAGSNERGGVLVHPSGKYIYAVASSDNQVHAFAINQSTGALSELTTGPFDASGGGLVVNPYGVAVDPTGAYFFTKGEEGDTNNNYMAGFSVDIATGDLTVLESSPYGPFPGDDAFHGLCFHPTLSVLYTSFYDTDTSDVGAFTLNLGTGALIPMEGSPYDLFSNHGSDNITVDRSGQFAFAANWNGNLIGAMRVTSTGLLTTTSGAALSGENETTIPVGNNPDSIVVAGTLQTLVPD